jgi:hypothetical protein
VDSRKICRSCEPANGDRVRIAPKALGRFALIITLDLGCLGLVVTQPISAAPKKSPRKAACGFPAAYVGENNSAPCSELR